MILKNTPENVEKIVDLLKSEDVAALPTETVYGLAARIDSKSAVQKVYELKGRPAQQPLSCHFESWDQVKAYVKVVPEVAEKMAKRFLPGALTLILEKNEKIPDWITGNKNSVGIRISSISLLRNIVSKVGVPLAMPSANLSGNPPPVSAEEVEKEFDGKVLILDLGHTEKGEASSIVDLSAEPYKILRVGSISKENLESFL